MCPMTDKFAKQKCGPTPVKLNQKTYSNECFLPVTPTFSTFFTPQDIEGILYPEAKTPSEVLDYMSCYRASDDRFCHFKTSLAPAIELASKSAGLSFAVASCLYKQESQFYPSAVSAAKASGYVQFMPGAITEMNQVLKGSINEWEAQVANAKQNMKENEALLAKTKDKKARAIIQRRLNYNDGTLRSAGSKIAARKVWDNYWQGTKNAPKQVKLADTACTNIAFAMGAAKQVMDLVRMRGIEEDQLENGTRVIGEMNPVDSQIFLSGAYNVGITSFANRCGDTEGLDECMSQFSKKHETYRHMKAIQNCAAKGSFEPKLSDNKKDCEKTKCGY